MKSRKLNKDYNNRNVIQDKNLRVFCAFTESEFFFENK